MCHMPRGAQNVLASGGDDHIIAIWQLAGADGAGGSADAGGAGPSGSGANADAATLSSRKRARSEAAAAINPSAGGLPQVGLLTGAGGGKWRGRWGGGAFLPCVHVHCGLHIDARVGARPPYRVAPVVPFVARRAQGGRGQGWPAAHPHHHLQQLAHRAPQHSAQEPTLCKWPTVW